MKRSLIAGSFLLSFALCQAGCSGTGAGAEGGKTPGKESGKPVVAVETTRAAASDLVEGIDVTGALSARFQSDVKSEVGGTVTDVYVAEWVRVKKGAPLAKVDARETEVLKKRAEASVEMAKAGLLEARAAANRAERELERARKLKEAGLVTQQGLDDALTQKEASAARVAAAAAQVRAAEEDVRQAATRISKAVIRAPFDGIIAERSVSPGEVVGEMQKVVFRIVDVSLLDLTVSVPSGESCSLRVGQPLTFSTDAVPGKTFAGKIKHINPTVGDADRSVKVVAEVRNGNGELKSGLYVKGRIVTGKRQGVLQVPRTSLLSWDVPGKKGDLLVVGDNVARRRAVRTGSTEGDLVEIASGLSKGEDVVTRGGFNVRDGDRVSVTMAAGGK
ncbi:MAG: efflux RND transporter periplasmic adaptor subunit [Deltaproteobacteria bacterium]|nr:efflux RND transporter periplasmic adaptor subunit [Deltaproteobacteria bacterium]